MSRGRLLPSLNYRTKNMVDMSIPNQNLRGLELIEVYGASNISDAFTNPLKMFELGYDFTFKSPSIVKSKIRVEESSRDQTRFMFILDDYATAAPLVGSRIPTNDEVCYLRVRGKIRATGAFTDFGPIVVLVPYDFFGVTSPVFTATATAPDIGADLPDSLDAGGLNLHLPNFSQAIDIENLSEVAGEDLYFSCSPGMSPTIIKPGSSMSLNSSSVGEFFFGGKSSTPLFTMRCSVVNRG